MLGKVSKHNLWGLSETCFSVPGLFRALRFSATLAKCSSENNKKVERREGEKEETNNSGRKWENKVECGGKVREWYKKVKRSSKINEEKRKEKIRRIQDAVCYRRRNKIRSRRSKRPSKIRIRQEKNGVSILTLFIKATLQQKWVLLGYLEMKGTQYKLLGLVCPAKIFFFDEILPRRPV
jgi:hypothetical protein